MLRGMNVTVVHVMPWLMERQLDDVAGRLLQKSLEDRGLQVPDRRADRRSWSAATTAASRRSASRTAPRSPADLVVMAVGIRPNTELAEKMRLHCNRGIVVNDTMQTVTDARIYSVGECAAHRGIAYGLVAPLFEQAKVAANHLAQFGIGRYTGLAHLDQAQGHRHRPVLGRRLHGRRRHRGDRDERPLRRRLQEAGDQGRQAGRRLPLRRHGRRQLVLQAAARRPQRARHPRQADVRRIEHRRHRPRGPQQGGGDARRRRGLRLQRREQGHDLQGDQGQGPVHARRGAASTPRPARQLRLVHRPGRADPDVHRRRRLLGRAEEEGDVRLHRRTATRTCATRSARSTC